MTSYDFTIFYKIYTYIYRIYSSIFRIFSVNLFSDKSRGCEITQVIFSQSSFLRTIFLGGKTWAYRDIIIFKIIKNIPINNLYYL